MKDQITSLTGHLLWNGREYFTIDGRPVSPGQLMWSHNYPETYERGVVVFPYCGLKSCIAPDHLKKSVIAARFAALEEEH